MRRSPRRRRGETIAALLVCLMAAGFQIVAIHEQSLTGDGAYHLLAGHQALRYGQNTVNLEHPPLVKLVVALPLLAEAPLLPPIRVDDALAAATRIYRQPELLRRAAIRGRTLALAVWVIPFLLACYALGRRFGDRTAGVVLALMVALSLGVLPYLTILQTDTAVALAFLLTLLAAIRYAEKPGYRRAAWLGLGCGLGLAVKFSAVLLGPTVLLSVLMARTVWSRRIVQLMVIAAVALAVVEGSYLAANRAYASETGREVIRTYCDNRGTLTVGDRMASAEAPLLALERLDPRLAQWATGFWGVRLQNEIGVYPSFAFGEVQSQGRWWYFPVVLLIKTPLPMLIAALLALLSVVMRRWPRGAASTRRPWALLAVTVGVYMAAAVSSNYNLSVRHMLPIVPMLYLPVALAASRSRPGRWLVIGSLVLESFALMPLWMSSTNTWWLGSRNPTRFALAAGNLEYRQNFIQLARYAERHGLSGLNVVYPSVGEEVIRAYLPDARVTRAGEDLEPGWYAVNVVVEQFIPALLAARPGQVWDYDNLHRAAERWRPTWQSVKRGEDHGYVAGTFHLYRLAAASPGAAAAAQDQVESRQVASKPTEKRPKALSVAEM